MNLREKLLLRALISLHIRVISIMPEADSPGRTEGRNLQIQQLLKSQIPLRRRADRNDNSNVKYNMLPVIGIQSNK
jgi:hypothetical protein